MPLEKGCAPSRDQEADRANSPAPRFWSAVGCSSRGREASVRWRPLFRGMALNQGIAQRQNLSRLGLRWWLGNTSCIIGSTALVGEHWSLSGNHFDFWERCNEVDSAVKNPLLAKSPGRNVMLYFAGAS